MRPSRPPWPTWSYFPHNAKSPAWVSPLLDVIRDAEPMINTTERQGPRSDEVLASLAAGMTALGYQVESSKSAEGKVRRPVLYGENGVPTVTYEIDAAHDDFGIVVEVEAGRGARGNAAYRDIIRTSLILDVRHLVLLMPLAYRLQKGSVPAYRDARDMLDAIYASRRLQLPFEGVLLVGY